MMNAPTTHAKLQPFIGGVVLAALLIMHGGCFLTERPNQVNPIIDRLPEAVAVLNSYSNTAGMDAFFVVKASYESDHEIDQIISEFRLLPGEDSLTKFSRDMKTKFGVSWVQLTNVSKTYGFCSFNEDGTFKEGVRGRYENVLWVDETKKELVILVMAM